MKLKELYPLMSGEVILYEESKRENEYDEIFIGNSRDIPEEMLEREIAVISVSTKGNMLDVELRKLCNGRRKDEAKGDQPSGDNGAGGICNGSRRSGASPVYHTESKDRPGEADNNLETDKGTGGSGLQIGRKRVILC